MCFYSAHRQQRELGAGWSLCDCRKESFPAHNHPIPSVSPSPSALRGEAGRPGFECVLSHLSPVLTSLSSRPRLHHEASASSPGALDTWTFVSLTVLSQPTGLCGCDFFPRLGFLEWRGMYTHTYSLPAGSAC